MQQVSAFSRPQTVPAVPTAAPRKTFWILDSWRDLILYVGTPLLLVPLFAVAQARWSADDIYLFVAAFGAMGHHLPGMIRAYGDRALFERFKWRFIFAPLFLLVVCTTFYWWDLQGMVLVVFFWGVWHGMMQTYGFCRIYDAKMGSFAALTRRLDFALCAVWFATAIFVSSQRMTDTLDAYYAAGGPFITPTMIRLGQQMLLAVAVAVSALFVANFIWMWMSGKRPNPVKLALLVTSISFWWYCNNLTSSILVGIALFEVFHDVQYLSLVWIYNRNRVEKDKSIGGFMRFVFRRSGSLMGLYIGLIFAYGSLGYINSHLGVETVKRLLTGVVTASALLHFYYDGFIWKVRERSTRESLGLAGGAADTKLGGFLPSWAVHGAKWVAVFVIPLGALWLGQIYAPRAELARSELVVTDLPIGARQHYNYGTALQKTGRLREATEEFYTALRFDPHYTKAHVNLANALAAQMKLDEAEKHFAEAVRTEPQNADFHSAYAYLLERMGRKEQALGEFDAASRLNPKSARLLYTYGAFLDKNGQLDKAIAKYQLALEIDPNYADAHSELATALFSKGDLQHSEEHYQAAIRLDPKRTDARVNLGSLFLRQGQVSQAIVQYEEALRIDPTLEEAKQNLAIAKATDTRFGERGPK